MIGYKLVMLGDETWIKLFPKLFWRQDGVSSFYVKDTVEVDFNVSRHLESEFAAKDWNMLVCSWLSSCSLVLFLCELIVKYRSLDYNNLFQVSN
jgi:hypothetical protein